MGLVGGTVVYRLSQALTLMFHCLYRKLPPCISPDRWGLHSLRLLPRSSFNGRGYSNVSVLVISTTPTGYLFLAWFLVKLWDVQLKDFPRPQEISGYHWHLLDTHLFLLYAHIRAHSRIRV